MCRPFLLAGLERHNCSHGNLLEGALRGYVTAVMPKDSRDLIKELEAEGWRFVGATGSHHHYKHATRPGKVTVPHPKRDLHPKTVRSIYKQAGIKEPR